MSNLYFAYGSNLNENDFRARVSCRGHDPDAIDFESGRSMLLPDSMLAFSHRSEGRNGGVLNVVPRKGCCVRGVVLDVKPGGWKVIDSKEGSAYERVPCTVIDECGGEVEAHTYVVKREKCIPGKPFVDPHASYVEIVREGMNRFAIPHADLQEAAANRPAVPYCDALFVYGTLMRGECRENVVKALKPSCILLAECVGTLWRVGSYPGLRVVDVHAELVRGEFIKFTNVAEAFETLDTIEAFYGSGDPRNLYRRALQTVDVGEGRLRLAWTYLATDAVRQNSRPIHSNCWRTEMGRWDTAVAGIVASHLGDQAVQVLTKLNKLALFRLAGDNVSNAVQLVDLLQRGALCERRLAQASNKWA